MLFTETAHFVGERRRDKAPWFGGWGRKHPVPLNRPGVTPARALPHPIRGSSLLPACPVLQGRPRATTPHRLDQELCFWGSRGPVLPVSAARRSVGDYWLSPQRRHPPGAAWRWPARKLLLLPGDTGLADVPSARWPSCYGARPRLT
ncbi:hypothetical protein P7K49_015897 [Saguinus oedipus]|uniref:Uncharacterized protein n=1 Tax=Saguinus oedipus TaxID=9490 RepID=A0ABQ9VAJ2_SAGOE|nr:hypothetical protein P7K49_015897 [Saguinus oedipus]